MDTEGEALADVAYGLFEILLNRHLKRGGHFLFELVESGRDFKEEFTAAFLAFAEDYPELSEALLTGYGTADAIYDLFVSGEGVIPTKTTRIFWILQDAPGFAPGLANTEKAGKWLIFLERDEADEMWKKIRDATSEGRLGISAKVSTAKQNPESRDERMVIYVHTADWADEDDVMKIRESLRSMGVEQRIGYKRNIETFQGEYSEKGKKVTYYSA
ncbi:MAG TPA: DUF1917 domain-containing protein [Methanoculleus sp.]|nr:DUF1917 domain-containing protein [Methanoculleus sp.]